MAKEKALKIDDVTITFYKSKRAKRMSISIKPFVGIRVAVPRLTPFFVAEKFAKSRIDWIKTNLLKSEAVESKQTVFTQETEFRTKHHKLHIVKENVDQSKFQVKNGTIKVVLPISSDISIQENQLFIKKTIEHTLRKEAKDFLPSRLNILAQQNNLDFNKVFIKNAKTRWGSCSSVNNINLNLHLMRLPNHLIDYVILHELAHTKVKNHSNDFWNFLESICPNSKSLDKEMKNYNPKIY